MMGNVTTQGSSNIESHPTQEEGEETQMLGEGGVAEETVAAPVKEPVPDFFTIVRVEGHRRTYKMTMGEFLAFEGSGACFQVSKGPVKE